MKALAVCLLLLPFISTAQKSTGYFMIKGSGIKFTGSEMIAAGFADFGVNTKKGGSLGAGIGVTKFKGADDAYVPIYLSFSFLKFQKKPSPYINMQIGRGVYQTNTKLGSTYIDTKAGLYLSGGLGICISASRKAALVISANYVNAAFSTKTRVGSSTNNTSSNSEGFAVSLGFAFK